MSLQDLGAIGEFLGSFFVLATLIYLAVQVRHSRDLLEENRKLALSAAYQARTGFRMDLAKDSMDSSWVAIQSRLRGGYEMPPVEVMMENFDALTVEEKIKVMYWQEAVMQSVDNGLFQVELGLADQFVAQNAVNTIRYQYPFWQHTSAVIPPRVREWYARDQAAGDGG